MSAHAHTVPLAAGRTTAARGGGSRGTRLVLPIALVLALAGAAVAVQALIGVVRTPPGVGDAVPTSAGTVTVARASSTFVPDTQGPPSAGQHAGTAGSWQIQVWVRVANEQAAEPLTFDADRLQLVLGATDAEPMAADGSSIAGVTVPRGTAIDGQVWFDVPAGADALEAGAWLSIQDPSGGTTRVPLNPTQTTVPPHDHSSDDGHEDHDHE
jgi:hypothetical protein